MTPSAFVELIVFFFAFDMLPMLTVEIVEKVLVKRT